MKLKIENLDQVLAAAKLKQKGWKRDYDKEPWVDDKAEWFQDQAAKKTIMVEAVRLERDKEQTARLKKNEFKRWRKRK